MHTCIYDITCTYTCVYLTQFSIDSGVVSSTTYRDMNVSEVTSITLGTSDTHSLDHFDGCLSDFSVNFQQINLASAVNDTLIQNFTTEIFHAVPGCRKGSECSNLTTVCPTHSVCENGWQTHTCVCEDGFMATEESVCVDPCDPNPCQNRGVCIPGNPPRCECRHGYRGPTCSQLESAPCHIGFHSPPNCRPCYCDLSGVLDGVCDDSGTCLCNVSQLLFSAYTHAITMFPLLDLLHFLSSSSFLLLFPSFSFLPACSHCLSPSFPLSQHLSLSLPPFPSLNISPSLSLLSPLSTSLPLSPSFPLSQHLSLSLPPFPSLNISPSLSLLSPLSMFLPLSPSFPLSPCFSLSLPPLTSLHVSPSLSLPSPPSMFLPLSPSPHLPPYFSLSLPPLTSLSLSPFLYSRHSISSLLLTTSAVSSVTATPSAPHTSSVSPQPASVPAVLESLAGDVITVWTAMLAWTQKGVKVSHRCIECKPKGSMPF